MELNVFTKRVYGVDKMYIAGTIATVVTALTGRKTVERRDLDALEALGLKVRVYDAEVMASTAMERGE